MESMKEEKGRLRSFYLEKRALLPKAYCRGADLAITEQIAGYVEYRKARLMFVFVGTDREIDTVPIIEKAWADGKDVCVPLCIGRGEMEARQIKSLEQLRPGSYGILEPVRGCPRITPGEIELALLPCLSCTREGRRLGYGGGYYDRYLPDVKAAKAVLCRERLLADALPREAHDMLADAVITEAGIWLNGLERTD